MTELPPEDRAPSFPPGPKGPEDPTPGAEVALSAPQRARLIQYVEGHNGTISVVERGDAYVEVRLFDADGNVADSRLIPPV